MAAKEVHAYARALRDGFEAVQATGLLTVNAILAIQATIEENQAGFRRVPGTVLKNDQTGAVVFVPPSPESIPNLMSELETFINDDQVSPLDPLIKMALIHHRFETIHPFYDGNGRTGRIINILYLVQKDLLTAPILYLSRYINRTRPQYYHLLQSARVGASWSEWIMYMLQGVEETSTQTTRLVLAIGNLMQAHKRKIREELPRIYSQDLLNAMFGHPYSKVALLQRDLAVSRGTAVRYLDELSGIGLMEKLRVGRENYYVNQALVHLLQTAHD